MHAGALDSRHRGTAHAVEKPRIRITDRGVGAAIRFDSRVPFRLAGRVDPRIVELRTVQFVAVQIDNDLIAILEKADRPSDSGLLPDMSDHKADGPARKASIRHQADDNAAFPAQGGDARRGVQHFRHAAATDRPFIANDDHVAILEFLGRAVEHLQELLLTIENPRGSGEHIVFKTTFDASEFQHGAELGREVAAKNAKSACRLVG